MEQLQKRMEREMNSINFFMAKQLRLLKVPDFGRSKCTQNGYRLIFCARIGYGPKALKALIIGEFYNEKDQ